MNISDQQSLSSERFAAQRCHKISIDNHFVSLGTNKA